MKKILALMLCIVLIFFTFSCNKVEEPTEQNIVGNIIEETNNTEETENIHPESEQLYISLVKDNKISIPIKPVKEIKCQKNYRASWQHYHQHMIGDELIFRTPEKIEEIIAFFQGAEVSEGVQLPTGTFPIVVSIYFTDNTHIVFYLMGEALRYSPDNTSSDKFYFPKYNEVQSVLGCSTY